MNIRVCILLITISMASCNTQPKTDVLVLKKANVIDVKTGKVITNSLLIKENRIEKIGPFESFSIGNGDLVIDCEGKYVMPGLFDMHMHILEHYNSSKYLNDLLLTGVTSIRDMGGHPDSIANVKERLERGEMSGPNLYFPGYTLDGLSEGGISDSTHKVVSDNTDLTSLLDSLKGFGIDFIKVHNYFPSSRIEELVKKAQESDLYVVGHIPVGLSPEDVIALGFKSIEHMNSLLSGLIYKQGNEINTITEAFQVMDSIYIDSLASKLIESNVAITPTLYVIDKSYQANWSKKLRDLGKLMLDRFNIMVLQMQRKGVLILAGSDNPPTTLENIDVIHKELAMLVAAGLTNLEALQTATTNAAYFLNIQNDFGAIEENKIADILVLNGNPLSDISNTSSVYQVIKSGKIVRQSLALDK